MGDSRVKYQEEGGAAVRPQASPPKLEEAIHGSAPIVGLDTEKSPVGRWTMDPLSSHGEPVRQERHIGQYESCFP